MTHLQRFRSDVQHCIDHRIPHVVLSLEDARELLGEIETIRTWDQLPKFNPPHEGDDEHA